MPLFLLALLLLVVRHLFLLANIVTTSKALVTSSDALVSTSFLSKTGNQKSVVQEPHPSLLRSPSKDSKDPWLCLWSRAWTSFYQTAMGRL